MSRNNPRYFGPSGAFGVRELTVSAADRRDEVMSETAFLKSISVERKRSERCGRPLLLMLISQKSKYAAALMPEAAAVVNRARREIDYAGWFRNDVVFGVVFTELTADPSGAVAAIKARIPQVLRVELGYRMSLLNIDFILFPTDCERSTEKSWLALYPEALTERRQAGNILKRATDIVFSGAMLVLLSPLLLVIASAIRVGSPGPILFRQKRFGRNARQFTMLKFRTMYEECDSEMHRRYTSEYISGARTAEQPDGNGGSVYKLTSDPRITAVGHLLRKFSLDELPQLINVLYGEMSLVGPRPPIEYEVAQYLPWHRARLIAAKPGLTGLWQISGRSRTSFDESVRLDLSYIRNRSFWLDCSIILRTPSAVLTAKGAY